MSASDPSAVELGLKWQSVINGYVTGVRFYKGPSNTGAHTGTLWSNTGAVLATVTFAGESASGWQEAYFSSPVHVNANTTYVISYHTTTGFYSADLGYFTTVGATSGPLTALSNGTAGGNGVYLYGAGGFPTNSFNAANYWVDVIFNTSAVGDVTNPTVVSRVPAANDVDVLITSPVTVTFSEAVTVTGTPQLTLTTGSSATTLVDSLRSSER